MYTNHGCSRECSSFSHPVPRPWMGAGPQCPGPFPTEAFPHLVLCPAHPFLPACAHLKLSASAVPLGPEPQSWELESSPFTCPCCRLAPCLLHPGEVTPGMV